MEQSVMRYFFHLLDRDELIEDHEGIEASDARHVVEEAVQAVREMAFDGLLHHESHSEAALVIHNDEGQQIGVVRLNEVLGGEST
jgi:hypothetical protein